MHACDWYATLCAIVGVDPADSHPDVPGLDSIDQWPTLLKPNATWEEGVRQEMVISYNVVRASHPAASGCDAALIQKQFKIVTGHQGGSGFWTGPVHPNATGPADPTRNGTACGAFSCCNGCLFDIQRDPTGTTPPRFVRRVYSILCWCSDCVSALSYLVSVSMAQSTTTCGI